MIEMGILDPTKVTRTALQNAASVSALMLTTECMVAESPKDDAPAGGMGGGRGGMGGPGRGHCLHPGAGAWRLRRRRSASLQADEPQKKNPASRLAGFFSM